MDYTHGHNNPNQNRPADAMTLGEALDLIAQRTPFGSEEERASVRGAIGSARLDELVSEFDNYSADSPAETPSDQPEQASPRKVAPKRQPRRTASARK